jgi:hypothetical protein
MRAPAIALVLVAATGCAAEPAEPTTTPLPAPDGRPAIRASEPLSPRIANYRIEASYDAKTHRIAATETLTWRNTSTRPVTELPFHLYMNAFKSDDTLFMRSSGGAHRRAEASDEHRGWIDVSSIRINGGDELRPTAVFVGPDETVLQLPATVEPGHEVAIDLGFEVQLPQVFARTGFQGDFAMVGQWFPKIGVLVGPPGAERWHCEPFHVNAEFFADFGTYDVTLVVPDTHVVAASGVLVAADDLGDGRRSLRYRAEDVHDFAWMIDPYMQVITGTAKVGQDQVEVRVYFRAPQRAFAERHLRAGIVTIEKFSELLVPYPWPIMSIIDPPPDAAAGAGGMEYPTIVTTAGDLFAFEDGGLAPEFVTVHEVGHNWFQGILASNEVEEAWLDEGVNEYFDHVAMERVFDDGFFPYLPELDGLAMNALGGRAAVPLAMPSDVPARDFPTPGAYSTATYTWTSLALRTLEHAVGSERMLAAMRGYAERWAYRHPTGDDFFAALRDQLGARVDDILVPLLRGRDAPRFRADRITCFKERCEVLVTNRSEVRIPVDIEVRFADGRVGRVRWDDGAAWRKLIYPAEPPVTEVMIDPDGVALVNLTPVESALRRRAETAAARRAAARESFWLQTALQVLGL